MQPAEPQARSAFRRMSGYTQLIIWVLLCAPLAWAVWLKLVVNPLPPDEEMIAHLRAHRAEFEALVQSYRTYESKSANQPDWSQLPETVALLRKIDVKRVAQGGAAWLPDPYSADSFQRQLAELERAKSLAPLRKYEMLMFEPADRRYTQSTLIRGWPGLIWKDYAQFPQVPRVENQALWSPPGPNGKVAADRVFASLDEYPPGWKKGECVYRMIEPQWFISMCWAY